MGYKLEGITCNYCGHDEFFVGALGIEHCTECFGPRVETGEKDGKD